MQHDLLTFFSICFTDANKKASAIDNNYKQRSGAQRDTLDYHFAIYNYANELIF